MIKQKSKFWAFIFSLIPGCGQLYLGFQKRGVTLMVYFWASIILSGELSLFPFTFVAIVTWFFAFFDTMTLNSASPETFALLKDQFLLPTEDYLSFANKHKVPRYIGIAFIVMGVFILWQSVALSFISQYFSHELYYLLSELTQYALRVMLAVAVIAIGIRLARGKKAQLEHTGE